MIFFVLQWQFMKCLQYTLLNFRYDYQYFVYIYPNDFFKVKQTYFIYDLMNFLKHKSYFIRNTLLILGSVLRKNEEKERTILVRGVDDSYNIGQPIPVVVNTEELQ